MDIKIEIREILAGSSRRSVVMNAFDCVIDPRCILLEGWSSLHADSIKGAWDGNTGCFKMMAPAKPHGVMKLFLFDAIRFQKARNLMALQLAKTMPEDI